MKTYRGSVPLGLSFFNFCVRYETLADKVGLCYNTSIESE